MTNRITYLVRGLSILGVITTCLVMFGCSPLLSAARGGNTTEVRKLLDNGADVNENFSGETALVYASIQGNTEIVQLLLDRGASVNASTGYGLTPLFYAVQRHHENIAKLLIEHGADVEGTRAKLLSLGTDGAVGLALLNRLANKPAFNHHAQAVDKQQTPPPSSEPEKVSLLLHPHFQAPSDNNAIAIVIGIEKYQSLPSAKFVRSDASLMRDYLRAMGYQDRNIEFLTDERATFSSIRKAVETWLPNRINPKSRVTVYYAGHGAPEPKTGDAYIVPYDGDPNYLNDTGYPLKRLYEHLENLPAQQVVVLVDACFSGAGGRGVLASGARSLVRVEKVSPKGNRIAVLTSTQGTQISSSSSEKKQGIFTYYLLQAFQEGNRDLASVYDYLLPRVEDEAKRMNVEQTPSISPNSAAIKGRFRLW